MIFQDLEFNIHIGCYEPERSKRQKIVLWFEATLRPIPQEHRDDPEFIVLDYASSSHMLRDFLENKEFRLIETAAEGAAMLLLKNFDIEKVTVRLKKAPADMPQGSSVIYECTRGRNTTV